MGATLTVAVVLISAAVVAAVFSVELGVSVAVLEILAGIVIGNTLHLGTPDWLVFLASFGSVVLTFLGYVAAQTLSYPSDVGEQACRGYLAGVNAAFTPSCPT